MTTFTATRTRHGRKTTVTITDAEGTVTDRTSSETMVYVEVLVTAGGKVLARSQSVGGTAPTARRVANHHPGAKALIVNETPKETTMLDHDTLVRLHTTPSGKTTLWGVEGREETFKSKNEALAFIKANTVEAPALEARTMLASETGILDEAPEVKAPKAPKAGTKAAPAPSVEFRLADVIPVGATTQASPSGSYVRVLVNGKSVGYVTFRKRGTLLAEVLTSRLGEATKADMKGTKARQNQTAVLVNSPATRDQARRLFALAAATVEVAA